MTLTGQAGAVIINAEMQVPPGYSIRIETQGNTTILRGVYPPGEARTSAAERFVPLHTCMWQFNLDCPVCGPFEKALEALK